MKQLISLLTLALALTGCGTLDPSGTYHGDKALYAGDLTLTTSYDVLHSFVQWEKDNRAALAKTPEVKAYADYIRTNAPGWFSTALAARDAYAAQPGPEQSDAFTKAVAVLHAAVTQATAYLAASTAPEMAATNAAAVFAPFNPNTTNTPAH